MQSVVTYTQTDVLPPRITVPNAQPSGIPVSKVVEALHTIQQAVIDVENDGGSLGHTSVVRDLSELNGFLCPRNARLL